MSIEISTQIIHASYAAVINSIDPNANIYDNPNQQGTAYPAWFIVHRAPVEVQRDVGKRYGGNRYTLTYMIDIWYMIQQNIPRLYDQYTQVAEELDSKIDYLPIHGSDAVVHVYDRSWSLELNCLKYSTTLRLRVYRDNPNSKDVMMNVLTTDVFLKMQNEAILSFQNTSHPEFDAQLPNPISVTKGRSVNLPFVGGEFEDDDYKWTPSGWNLGSFGALIQLNESMTADLLWRSEEKTASLSFTNTLHPEFDVDLPDTIIANKGSSVELPAVSGTFPVGSFDWNPSSWDIGSFGDSFILNEDTTANLQWESEEVFFDVSFTNTSHPEFDVTLPQSERVSRGSSVTLPTVEGEFIQDNYKWIPDAWDIGAFGDSYTPSDSVSANLLWRSEEIPVELPQYFTAYFTAGDGNRSGSVSSNWSSIGGNTASLYQLNSSNRYEYDASKTYTITSVFYAGGAIYTDSSLNRLVINNKNYAGAEYETLFIHTLNNNQITGKPCGCSFTTGSKLESENVKVYNSLNEEFNAFKYTANGIDYYYVLDGVQTDWTDDLTSIGYSLDPPAPTFPEVHSMTGRLGSSSSETGSSTINFSILANGRLWFFKLDGGSYSKAVVNEGTVLAVAKINNTSNEPQYYGFVARRVASDGTVRLMNNTYARYNNASSVDVYYCNDSNVGIATVTNGNGDKFWAFKYIVDGVAYYYVLDLSSGSLPSQSWISDLSSLGYAIFNAPLYYLSSDKTPISVGDGSTNPLYGANGVALSYNSSRQYIIINAYTSANDLIGIGCESFVVSSSMSYATLYNRDVLRTFYSAEIVIT